MDSSSSPSKRELSFFNAAKHISKLSDHRVPMGCVVVKNHRIISSGYNSQTKCHGKQALADKEYFKTNSKGPVHAEFSALNYLLNQKIDLSNSIIYVYREHKDGSLAMARPCPRCMALIKKCGIKKIRYTGDGSYIKEIVVE